MLICSSQCASVGGSVQSRFQLFWQSTHIVVRLEGFVSSCNKEFHFSFPISSIFLFIFFFFPFLFSSYFISLPPFFLPMCFLCFSGPCRGFPPCGLQKTMVLVLLSSPYWSHVFSMCFNCVWSLFPMACISHSFFL